MKKYVKPSVNTLKKPALLPLIVDVAVAVAVVADIATRLKDSSNINSRMLNELKPIV